MSYSINKQGNKYILGVSISLGFTSQKKLEEFLSRYLDIESSHAELTENGGC